MKYLLSSKRSGDIAMLEYDDRGIIKAVNFLNEEMNTNQVKFIFDNALLKSDLPAMLGLINTKDQTAFIEEVTQDLSFERFWEEYAYKVGKKDRCKRKWESMPDEEKVKALKHLKKYSFFLAERPHMEKKYPETYLNTAEWNN